MVDDKYKMLAKDTIMFGVSAFASKFMIFLLLPLYTNILSTTEYGEADLLINIVNLMYPLFTLAIVEGVLRFAFSREIKSNELIGSSLLIILGATVLLLIFYPFSGLFGIVLCKDWLYLMLLFLTYTLQNLLSSFCRASGRNKVFAIQGIVQTVSLLICNLVYLVFFDWGKQGYLLAIISAYLIACTYMLIAGKIINEIIPLKVNKELLKEMLKYSIPLVPSMIAWWINNSADKYVIIALVSIEASALYGVAHKIPTILTSISDVFNQAFLISSIKNLEDQSSKEYFVKISHIYLTINCFIASILILFSRELGGVFFSKEYYQGWIFVPLLVMSAVFSNLSAYLASFFRTLKNTKILFLSTLIGAIINICLNVIFVRGIGTIGAAYATVISFLIVFVIRYYSLKNIIDIKMFSLKSIFTFIIIFIQAVIVSSNLEFMHLISVFILVIQLLINHKEIGGLINILRNRI